MAEIDFLGKGVAFPFKSSHGELTSADNEALIEQSVRLILFTKKGERVMRPDFGSDIHNLVFAENNTGTASLIAFQIGEVLEKWEPRIDVKNVSVTPDASEQNKLMISVDYSIKANNSRRNTVFPFYLQGI